MALAPLLQQTSVETRTITYQYDGLYRLTGAQESGATTQSYSYSYDVVGNRTDGGRQYDAANQVIGWTYDAAGNLLSDRSANYYDYDALSRVASIGWVGRGYNGDGVLMRSGSTRYTQDLAAPLSQVLSDGTSTYVYGRGAERLLGQQGSTRTWYADDALGSVRATLDSAGTPQTALRYDPWGVAQTPAMVPFGFAGELQQGRNVYLRARWYNASMGRFTSRDPFAGYPNQPYSLHPYQYAYSQPTTLTDPSGEHPGRPYTAMEGVYAEMAIAALFYTTLGEDDQKFRFQLEIPYASTVNPNNPGYADLVNYRSGGVYEIKPSHEKQTAQPQARHYITKLQEAGKRSGRSDGRWGLGTAFLAHNGSNVAGNPVTIGMWPYGLDPSYQPDGKTKPFFKLMAQYYESGAIIYWGEPIRDDQERRTLLEKYEPLTLHGWGKKYYQNWRQQKWPESEGYNGPPQSYPELPAAPSSPPALPFDTPGCILWNDNGCIQTDTGGLLLLPMPNIPNVCVPSFPMPSFSMPFFGIP